MAIIKLSNDVLLDQASVDGMSCINTNNVLASNKQSYTATQDCFITPSMYADGNAYKLTIDNVEVVTIIYAYVKIIVPLKKGQKAQLNSGSFNVYGLKK